MSHSVLPSAVRLLSRHHRTTTTTSLSFSSGSRRSALFRRSPQQPGARAFSESKKSVLVLATPLRCIALPISLRQQRSAYSSAVRPGSQVVQNPRVDDDGNPLTIAISARAAERLREITDPSSSPNPTKTENPYHHLRITVTSGGCHGFQYLMSLEAASKIDAEEDTIFEADQPDAGSSSTAGKAQVVMDEPSLELLSGSTVDYTSELIGSQFAITDNPRASSKCGCGTSFDVLD